ncbi:hypothetical protein ACH4VR_23790 [Streptomyces sp. NPDC020883]|uniref:hypothetical protein n=1 Tax=Streptomyces sp. NPDC020883 TaxID=3365099 RepID=UPI00379EA85B
MALLAEYTVTAQPDRCLAEVYDSDAYLQDSAALEASREQVVAGNGYHLYLHSLQPAIAVDVIIRIWDEPQTPPAHCEGSTPVAIESTTACLVINQLTFGPAGTMDLPRPGVYEGIAWWTGRHAAQARCSTAGKCNIPLVVAHFLRARRSSTRRLDLAVGFAALGENSSLEDGEGRRGVGWSPVV